MASRNLYHRRLVADSSAKACWLDFKPSTTVLITPEKDDYFYVCPGHLKDRKFAIPKDEEDQAEKARKEALEKEIELVKKEYEAKIAKKLEKRTGKEAEKDGKKNNDEAKDDDKDEKEKEEKLKELEAKKEPAKAIVDGPRIFELQTTFWQMRLKQKRDAAQVRKNREYLRNPTSFPSVPSGDLGGS
ncbi:DUF1742-domain-containing protein [Polychaeton citri CBS 116435]|uniref:DUF1742-domain-containing protein n=1 Tax=Polychaeton citri CBS 116435 TaxID=1314669 RepID=A0A9P4QAW7_9PEZI|nr:DUF1742-domain-containing protein [Polychaeton citri CBS 116435]